MTTNIDPIPGYDEGDGSGQGFAIYRAPSLLYSDAPEIWHSVDLWRFGLESIGVEDLAHLSHWEVECLETLLGASQRKFRRAQERREQENRERSQGVYQPKGIPSKTYRTQV